MKRLAAVVVALVVVAGGFIGKPYVSDWRACRLIRANAAAEPAWTGAGTVAAVLGDSWTSGWRLPDPRGSFPFSLAEREGWRLRVDGIAGSGYTTSGTCSGEAFRHRVQAVPADATVVVIEGGINDALTASGLAALPAASATLVAEVHAQSPQARLVVVGIPHAPGVPTGAADRGNDALRRAGGQFVGVTGWPLEYQADGLHLTEAAHRVYADRLAAAIG